MLRTLRCSGRRLVLSCGAHTLRPLSTTAGTATDTATATGTGTDKASESFDYEKWTPRFLAAIKNVPTATDPAQSSRALRELVKSKELLFMDMKDNSEKFFMAHRLLASVGLGGFGIRFTVQFNLFAGSIVGLAGPEQLRMLDSIQANGQLGCFLLTERQAGVLSGLIVETTADWDEDTQEFILHTPSDKAAKNWISQGYTAELGVVIADLRVKGKSHGPHPFFIKLRDGEEGALQPGIRILDMGTKTVANDLDNARVWFDQVRLPKDALLNKFADIKDNAYVQVGPERMRIEVIGQRLLTGRMAIAQAALVSCRVLHMHTETYARGKVCNGLSGETSLYSMPQLKNVFDESYAELDKMFGFVAATEARLNDCLRNDTIPDEDLVDAISVCKIRAIRVSIERAHALRLEVGSYALMHGTGFELMDMLLCCKFAEGDSRILQMKLMRDRLKKVKKDGPVATALQVFSSDGKEALAALKLAQKLAPAGRDLKKMDKLFTKHWKEIYALAEIIEERHIASAKGKRFMEPIVDRLVGAGTAYDVNWKDKVVHGK
jgi:acyl-CoA oxidase